MNFSHLQVVVVLDPDTTKDYLDRVQNRSKEKKYTYDVAFSPEAKNAVIHHLRSPYG
jgi:kinesin family protein 18/19